MLLQNVLFRCGGAAILLSNKWLDGRRALAKLMHCVRVQGVDDASYACVYEKEDADGNHGVALGRDIVKVAGYAMEKNFTVLGPSVLPLSEQLKVRGARVSRARARARARAISLALSGTEAGLFPRAEILRRVPSRRRARSPAKRWSGRS